MSLTRPDLTAPAERAYKHYMPVASTSAETARVLRTGEADSQQHALSPDAKALNAFQSMRAAIDELATIRACASIAPDVSRYASIEHAVEALQPAEPVFCLHPQHLMHAAGLFASFPGRVLYAVKCNPHPLVLQTLYSAGITNFDVASIGEIEQIHDLFGARSEMFFNNPIKARSAIRIAAADHGVKFYAIDHESELDKVLAEAQTDNLMIAVRLATGVSDARYALTTKFGAKPDAAVALLQRIQATGLRAGITFHVGSQCLAPQSFSAALSLCEDVLRDAGVPLAVLNVGGGFPAAYPGDDVAPLERYFEAIETGLRRLPLPRDCQLFCEPGRSLVATGGSIIAQVLVRKDDIIYINDGIFGSLQELRHPKERRPARIIGRDSAADTTDFKVYGPTCDSDDVLGAPLTLPTDIAEGDRIEISMMGAYSLATRTAFNGFSANKIITIEP
ncbi:MAG: type III PLP-dependent enzyme [Vitreimonas sp.]